MDKSKLRKVGKKALLGLGAGLAAASMLVHSVFPDQKEILASPEEPPAIVCVQAEQEEPEIKKEPQVRRKRTWKERLRESLQRLPLSVRVLLLLPLWALGALLCFIWQRLLLPVLGVVLKPLLTLAVLFALILAGMKLLFPELTLRQLLCRKNRIAFAVLAVLCVAARILTEHYYPEKTLLPALVCLGIALLFFAAAALQYCILTHRAERAAAA